MVATAGNFLIDSQMQLAGKPSVIDPTRAIAKGEETQGPLAFQEVTVTPIEGDAGKQLEKLYAAYFDVQRAFAADQMPAADAAQLVSQAAAELSNDKAIPESARTLLQEIARQAEHLHHMDLAGARKAFKPISHAIVTLATQVRSADAEQAFTHFYCPMVPSGGGDWLQADGELANPYFGSEMPGCGEKVTVFPLQGKPASETAAPEQHGARHGKNEGA
jgi:Cu(I)/Ag(I) efflux system membrane fusion protein